MANKPSAIVNIIGKALIACGWDGSDWQALNVDSDGDVQVDVVSTALPTGAGTRKAAPAADTKGSVGSYAGVEIEITGLDASTPYLLRSFMCWLDGGTSGNNTQPSVGEASAFVQGDQDDRYKISATITDDDDRTVDNLATPVRVWSDANGKLYIKGAAPGAADSTLYWRADLDEDRSA